MPQTYYYGRLLFLDCEGRQVEDLTDLNHAAFVGGAPLRPFYELFFGVGLHHPITAQHFLRLDERPIGHRWLRFSGRSGGQTDLSLRLAAEMSCRRPVDMPAAGGSTSFGTPGDGNNQGRRRRHGRDS